MDPATSSVESPNAWQSSRTMVIAVDIDGTLLEQGVVEPAAVDALTAAAALGHSIVIVSGRTWPSLNEVVPQIVGLSRGVVAENGGLMVDTTTGTVSLLAAAANPALVDGLLQAGVAPLDVGAVALGAPTVMAAVVARVMAEVGGDEIVVRNKDSVMVLPPNCDKATGLRALLSALSLTDQHILAIGDAANDLPMFAMASHPRAVANADEVVRASGVPMTKGAAGLGVAEAIEEVVLQR
jgi:hydroxymethylpyrimidine pyrophosphatase-like HAD family hydrolase